MVCIGAWRGRPVNDVAVERQGGGHVGVFRFTLGKKTGFNKVFQDTNRRRYQSR